MAGLTGRFDADFETFYVACSRAQVSLKGFDAGANTVEKSINRMVDSLSGRQVITQATLMAEAVTKIGSPARLTASELQRVGNVAAEAAEKMKRWGQDVPPKIQALADAAGRARLQTDSLRGSFQAFDGVLAAAGIQLGPEIKGIEDIGAAAGKTAGELGAVATAGLTVGAAIGGWKIGRIIADFAGTDKIIGDATAKLLGWGDVAGQEAAAGADALAKASKSAGFAIHDMSTAMIVNEGDATAWAAKMQEASEAAERLNAPFRSMEAFRLWEKDIQKLRDQKLVESLSADIKSQAFSVAELAKNYTVSVGAIQQFIREENQAVDAVHKLNEQKLKDTQAQLDAKHLADAKKLAELEAKRARDQELADTVKTTQAAHDLGIAFDEAQTVARKKTEDQTKALEAQLKVANDIARSTGNSIDFDLSTPEGLAQFKRLNPGASVSAPADYFKTHSIADGVRDGLISFYSAYNTQGAGRDPVLARGGAALVGPTDLTVQVNVNGVFDPSSKAKLSGAVGSGLARAVSTGRLH